MEATVHARRKEACLGSEVVVKGGKGGRWRMRRGVERRRGQGVRPRKWTPVTHTHIHTGQATLCPLVNGFYADPKLSGGSCAAVRPPCPSQAHALDS